MATRSIAFESALQELATLLHRIALAQTVPQAIADDEPERMRLLDLATAFTPEDIQLYYQIAIHGRAEIELAPDEYAGFTMTLLRMLAFAPKGEAGGQEKSEGKREKGEGMGAPRAVPPIVQRTPIAPPTASVHHEPAPVYHEPVAPIAIPAPSAAPKPRLSNDTLPDWGALLGQLNMQGMALQLAKHCVLDSFSNGQMTLCLAEEFKHLQSNKPAIDRLQTTLSDHLGQVIKVQIVLGKPQVATPAHVENQVKQAMQQQANESIAQDSFVREAQDQLAAKIIPDSIKSIN
jgi:DNA polymerase-3 subunit gamma/tau